MQRLPFAKPERVTDRGLLVAYHRKFPRCEVLLCKRPAAPEPHHLIPRARGRDDREENLLSLCVPMHLEYHQLGGKRWFAKYQDRLEPEAIAKVRRALRME